MSDWPTVRSAVSGEVSETTIIGPRAIQRLPSLQPTPGARSGSVSDACRVREEIQPAITRPLARPAPAWFLPPQINRWPDATPWTAARAGLRGFQAKSASYAKMWSKSGRKPSGESDLKMPAELPAKHPSSFRRTGADLTTRIKIGVRRADAERRITAGGRGFAERIGLTLPSGRRVNALSMQRMRRFHPRFAESRMGVNRPA